MIKKLLVLLVLWLNFFTVKAQEINTDEIYKQALKEYRSNNYAVTVKLTTIALEVAPLYHDLRILRLRSYLALKKSQEADKDLIYLLKKAPQYEGVKELSLSRLFESTASGSDDTISLILDNYSGDTEIIIAIADLHLRQKKYQKAREFARRAYDSDSITDGQLYAVHRLLNQTVQDAVQVTAQYIAFSEEYPRNKPWHSLSAEYQHNFRDLAVIGRATYSDRNYNSGSLYELEVYPQISPKLYAFGNIGISNGEIFPDLRANASLFYNFTNSFEAEAGFRSLFYSDSAYLSVIAGLTTYAGRFYFNIRTFLGPKRQDQLLQNYQFNLRYYLINPENYLFLRLGSGFSPDEPTRYTQALENPTLSALYFTGGINKTIGIHHVIILGGGLLTEDLPGGHNGSQLSANLGYRYKF